MAAKKTRSKANPHDAILTRLRAFGLRYPGAHTKTPWPEHLDLAVKDKTFAFLPVEGQPFSISCKLPSSSSIALLLPFAKPTPYGLGKSGWVSASFAHDEDVPVEMLEEWIDESYRAVAPAKLVAELDARAPGKAAPVAKAPKKKATAKKTATAKKKATAKKTAAAKKRAT